MSQGGERNRPEGRVNVSSVPQNKYTAVPTGLIGFNFSIISTETFLFISGNGSKNDILLNKKKKGMRCKRNVLIVNPLPLSITPSLPHRNRPLRVL